MNTQRNIPLQIIFTNVDASEAVEAKIHEKVDKLSQFHPAIKNCRVKVEQQHKHHHQGNLFKVRIDVKVPGHELFSDRESDHHPAYTDVYVALRDAFNAMGRQLEDLVRHQQGHVKHHEERPHGYITEISPDKTFGRIEPIDGRWLYFHRNSLIGADLDSLSVGTPVYYVEEAGEQGPQASSVYPVGKHHILI